MPLDPRIPLEAAQQVRPFTNRTAIAQENVNLRNSQQQFALGQEDLASAQAARKQAGVTANFQKIKVLNEVLGASLGMYEDLIARGEPPEQATQKTQAVYLQALQQVAGTGLFKPEELAPVARFDPQQAKMAYTQTIGLVKNAELQQQRATLQQQKTAAESLAGHRAAQLQQGRQRLALQGRQVAVQEGNLALKKAEQAALTMSTAELAQVPPDDQRNILNNLSDIYGAENVTKEFIGNTLGQIWGNLTSEQVVRGRTVANTLKQRVKAALTISSRPPVMEQENILQIIPSTGLFQSVEDARARLTELRSILQRQFTDDVNYAARPGLTPKERRDTRNRARETRAVLELIGDPRPTTGGADVPEGVDPEDWEVMTPEQRALWP